MQYANLNITERSGWSKKIYLSKAITLVGSAPYCDVQLSGQNIAPVHLQLLSSSDLPTGCRLVNLTNATPLNINGAMQTLPQFGSYELHHQDQIILGEFRMELALPFSSDQLQKSNSMEASLFFSNAILHAEFPLEGKLTVKNLGKNEGTQFQVELQGLPTDCFQIDPIPLLYPGAQEEIRVRLFHHSLYPQAGQQTIYILVSAPFSYPGEKLVLQQLIYVAPVFNQTLELVDDIVAQKELIAASQPEIPLEEILIPPELPSNQDPLNVSPPEKELNTNMQIFQAPDDLFSIPIPPSEEKLDQNSIARIGNLITENPTISRAGEPLPSTENILNDLLAPSPSPDGGKIISDPPLPFEPDHPILGSETPGIVNRPMPAKEPFDEPLQPAPQPDVVNPVQPKLKVVRQPSNDFWNEG